MKPLGPAPATTCWHCGAPVDAAKGKQKARYIYRGEQPLTVLVEYWMHCTCGAYQNIRRINEITVDELGKN